MGYNTDLFGSFKLDRPLSQAQNIYLKKFSETRRMKRNASIADTLTDSARSAVGLPVGEEGEYFVGGKEDMFGQNKDESVIDYNRPPRTQPGLWCQWIPNNNGTEIEWDGEEKFYDHVEWIEYIIKNFIKPWNYYLNGEVEWQGDERDDIGKIVVKNNAVSIKVGKIIFKDEA